MPNINEFKKLPILGILRNISSSELEPLLETIIESGLKTVEIAMNASNAEVLIKEAVKISKGRVSIGAGTVLNMKQLSQACDAGAGFIVTPVLIEKVTNYCAKNKIPIFPGALTPTEIFRAWQIGASMVKVFPASVFGPHYFKELKGPFNDIELMAVGGVTAENVSEYFKSGASAVAFGASIFKRDWINKKDLRSIKESIKSLIISFKKRKI